MTEQLFEIGDRKDGLECTVVTYQEVEGVRRNFVYSFRPIADIEAEQTPVETEEEIA